MRVRRYSRLFQKQVRKLKGEELQNLVKKMDEIADSADLNHFKNLSHDLKRYKRVHVNDSFVILFFDDDEIVYFVDYAHHDLVYKRASRYFD